jgi:LAO/AO transport system kinase
VGSRTRTFDVAELRSADPSVRIRTTARGLSMLEDGAPGVPSMMAALATAGLATRVVGITGPPGVGKSTVVAGLIAQLRAAGRRVGVIAVDPTSPFSGGAVLGDRVRMQQHALDDGVFIRSMASRGHLGGLSAVTPQAIRVLAAAGCDVVVVETVGVGQSEVEVAALADTTVVVLAPGNGDAMQAAKAGILEVADLYLVNKADREGAAGAVSDLRGMLTLVRREPGEWRPPVLTSTALEAGGLTELVDQLAAHERWLTSSGALHVRREARARAEIESVALAGLRRRLHEIRGDQSLPELARRVAAGELDAFAAATTWTGPAS